MHFFQCTHFKTAFILHIGSIIYLMYILYITTLFKIILYTIIIIIFIVIIIYAVYSLNGYTLLTFMCLVLYIIILCSILINSSKTFSCCLREMLNKKLGSATLIIFSGNRVEQ